MKFTQQYKVYSRYRLKRFAVPSRKGDFYIGAVAEMTGLTVETIRYYEAAGVIAAPHRGDNRYRLYSDKHVERLSFVKRCRDLGFSLDHAKSLLQLADTDNKTCRQVGEIAERRLAEVRRKMANLRRMERALAKFVKDCPQDSSSKCPIIESLSQASQLSKTHMRGSD